MNIFAKRETAEQKIAREERERAAASAAAWNSFVSSVESLPLDLKGAELTFSSRLTKEYGWTDEQALAATREFRRFMILAASTDAPLVPSVTVDKVWRVLLLYNRLYISGLCARTLKKLIHRRPADSATFDMDAAHKQTIELYRQKFGEAPDWDGPATSYCRSVAVPQSYSDKAMLQKQSSDGSSGGWEPIVLIYIASLSSSYNADQQTHGNGHSSSPDASSITYSDSSSSSGGGGCGGGGGGGCGGGV